MWSGSTSARGEDGASQSRSIGSQKTGAGGDAGRAERRIEEDPERVAFLYADGHVQEYYGQHPLAKTKKSQHPAAQRAATDNWVHDANGEPLLVVTSEMNEGLTQVLEPILMEVKELVGDRRPIVIFDRGGWSPKLFARLDELGFDVMTYRKGKISPWPVSQFVEVERVVEGRRYWLPNCGASAGAGRASSAQTQKTVVRFAAPVFLDARGSGAS